MTEGDDRGPGDVWADLLGGWLGEEPTRRTLRAIVDTQRRGIDAASRIVERISDAVDGDDGTSIGLVDGDAADADSLGRLRRDALRVVDQVADMTARLLETSFDALGAGTGGGTEVLRFDPGPPGRTARVVVHLQGRGSATARPHVTRFETADGQRIGRKRMQVEPVTSSNGPAAAIVVDIPADQPAGTYHALVLAGDDAALHVILPVSSG